MITVPSTVTLIPSPPVMVARVSAVPAVPAAPVTAADPSAHTGVAVPICKREISSAVARTIPALLRQRTVPPLPWLYASSDVTT